MRLRALSLPAVRSKAAGPEWKHGWPCWDRTATSSGITLEWEGISLLIEARWVTALTPGRGHWTRRFCCLLACNLREAFTVGLPWVVWAAEPSRILPIVMTRTPAATISVRWMTWEGGPS